MEEVFDKFFDRWKCQEPFSNILILSQIKCKYYREAF